MKLIPLALVGTVLAACDPCAGTIGCTNPPEIHASGEMIVHASGAAAPGVQITFARDSGVALVSDSVRATSSPDGHFALRVAAYADGEAYGSLIITPRAPFSEYTVRDFRLRTTRMRGDGIVLGRLVVDPYILLVGEVRDYWSGAPLAAARVTARRVSGASFSPDTFTVTTGEEGRFFFQPAVRTFGRWTADFEVEAAGYPRKFLIRQTHDAQFTDGEFRFVLLFAGRKLQYVAQAVRRGTVDGVAGTSVEITRTGGIAIEPATFTSEVNSAGGFAIQPRPLDDGELVFDLTIRPPVPFSVQTYRGLRIQTHDDDSTRHIGLFGIGHWIPSTVTLVDDATSALVPGVSVAFVRTSGITVSQPFSTRADANGVARLDLGPTTAGQVVGNLVITQASGFRDTTVTGVQLTATEDDTLRSIGIIRLRRSP